MRTEDIARWRLRTLRLSGEPLGTADEIVGWLGAVQAQDYGPSKWSVGQRSLGLTDLDLERAMAEGSILRTHVLRPTWHFVRPADIRWLLALTRARVQSLSAHGRRREGVDGRLLSRAHTALADALAGGRHLTRDELGSSLAQVGIDARGSRLAHIVMHAELEGLLCSGAPRGKQQTYALLDERVPPTAAVTRDEALVELTRRYFTSHGPASARDLQWWSSLTLADVKRGIALSDSLLRRQVIDRVTYWVSSAAMPESQPCRRLHLLHMFDEYLVGYSETRGVMDVAGRGGSQFSTINVRSGVIILDGQLAGTWRRTLTRDRLTVEPTPSTAVDPALLEAEADRLSAFRGLPATLRV